LALAGACGWSCAAAPHQRPSPVAQGRKIAAVDGGDWQSCRLFGSAAEPPSRPESGSDSVGLRVGARSPGHWHHHGGPGASRHCGTLHSVARWHWRPPATASGHTDSAMAHSLRESVTLPVVLAQHCL
jgi:hypothetical protein